MRPQLDTLPAADVVGLLLDAEQRVVPAVRAATGSIAAAAELICARMRSGAALAFVGAGTSGRIAAAEAAELPGTFGIDRDRVRSCVAGGSDSTDEDEDDLSAAHHDLAALSLAPGDVLVAVAASGSTPYTLAVTDAARSRRISVVAVTTRAGSALAGLADVAIEVIIGSEVLRGSTRLSAGTAQKLALNALTTAAMARLGRVHGDLMIDVEPANVKLQQRAAGIVAEIAGTDLPVAEHALEACGGNARAAALHLVLGLSPRDACERATAVPHLRTALVATQ